MDPDAFARFSERIARFLGTLGAPLGITLHRVAAQREDWGVADDVAREGSRAVRHAKHSGKRLARSPNDFATTELVGDPVRDATTFSEPGAAPAKPQSLATSAALFRACAPSARPSTPSGPAVCAMSAISMTRSGRER